MLKAITKFPATVAISLLASCGTSPMAPQQNGIAPQSNAVEQPAKNSDRPAETNACLVQDGRPIAKNRIHAIGTEPFWAADVVGRCVTYSTPEDEAGTRVWTKFSGSEENGIWSGALGGSRFELRTAPQANCSDGMSDKSYSIAVTLAVGGEERRGCAERR